MLERMSREPNAPGDVPSLAAVTHPVELLDVQHPVESQPLAGRGCRRRTGQSTDQCRLAGTPCAESGDGRPGGTLTASSPSVHCDPRPGSHAVGVKSVSRMDARTDKQRYGHLAEMRSVIQGKREAARSASCTSRAAGSARRRWTARHWRNHDDKLLNRREETGQKIEQKTDQHAVAEVAKTRPRAATHGDAIAVCDGY